MTPYPTWPPEKRWPFAALCAVHGTRVERQMMPDRLCDDLTSRGWVEAQEVPAGVAEHHAILRPTEAGRDIMRRVPRGICAVAATDGVRLMRAMSSGEVALREDWTLELRTLGRWSEYAVRGWMEP